MFLFKHNHKLFSLKDILEIKKKYKFKNLNILDFGCNTGVWEEKELKKKPIKIFLYDKNKKLIPILNKKYTSKKIILSFDKKKIFNKKINLIIFSSVIQYMSHKELRNIFLKIIKTYQNKRLLILVNDLPIFPRYIEIFLLPLINLKVFVYSLSLIFNKDYLKIRYFSHEIKKTKFILDNFTIKQIGYSKNMNFLREKLLLILSKS